MTSSSEQPKVQRNDRILDGSFTTMDVISYIKECPKVEGFYQVPDQRVKYFERVARSRPHPARLADQKAPICENCGLDSATCRMDMAGCLQAQNTAARKAREDVLKIVNQNIIYSDDFEKDRINSGWILSKLYFDRDIESLRTTTPHPAPVHPGCDGCRKEIEHLECPTPGNCDQMKCVLCCEGSDFPTLPEEIEKYEAEAARKARDGFAKKLNEQVAYAKKPHLDSNASFWDGYKACAEDTLESLRTTTPHTEQEQLR